MCENAFVNDKDNPHCMTDGLYESAKNIAKLCEQQTNALLYNLRQDVIEKRRRDSEFVRNCPNVEWEHEMGFTVPVCSIDGQYCNRQCRQQ